MKKTVLIYEENGKVWRGLMEEIPFKGLKIPAEVCGAAIQLAEIWGVMETLEKFPQLTTGDPEKSEENRRRLINWANDFVASGAEDLTDFLKERMESTGWNSGSKTAEQG